MSPFRLHSVAPAPAGSAEILESAGKRMGFIPNLYAQLAESPAALKAYTQLGALFEQSAFSPQGQQVLLLAVSAENGCEYCVAAHSFLARNVAKLPSAAIESLRDRAALGDPKLNALATFTRAVVRNSGWVADSAEFAAFRAAGYEAQHAIEVVLGVAMKTLGNYVNHLGHPPLDAAFADEAWQAEKPRACAAARALR